MKRHIVILGYECLKSGITSQFEIEMDKICVLGYVSHFICQTPCSKGNKYNMSLRDYTQMFWRCARLNFSYDIPALKEAVIMCLQKDLLEDIKKYENDFYHFLECLAEKRDIELAWTIYEPQTHNDNLENINKRKRTITEEYETNDVILGDVKRQQQRYTQKEAIKKLIQTKPWVGGKTASDVYKFWKEKIKRLNPGEEKPYNWQPDVFYTSAKIEDFNHVIACRISNYLLEIQNEDRSVYRQDNSFYIKKAH